VVDAEVTVLEIDGQGVVDIPPSAPPVQNPYQRRPQQEQVNVEVDRAAQVAARVAARAEAQAFDPEVLRLYPNDHYDLDPATANLVLSLMRDPTQFRFQMLEDLPMRQRLTVAISLAWHQMAIAQGIETNSHKIFTNEVAVLLGWSTLEDIITKDHKAREFFRKYSEMELVVMDERQLSPMQYASFLLPALTLRALQAPTVRAEVYHTLVEAFVKRLWPDMWQAILGAFCRVYLQPAEFRTLMQVPGTLLPDGFVRNQGYR
jgi:hypothetical protein